MKYRDVTHKAPQRDAATHSSESCLLIRYRVVGRAFVDSWGFIETSYLFVVRLSLESRGCFRNTLSFHYHIEFGRAPKYMESPEYHKQKKKTGHIYESQSGW